MLKIKNLHLSYNDKILIDNFSISVSHGENIAIMGRNGAGKSTLLRYISEHSDAIYIPQFVSGEGSGGENFMHAFHNMQKEMRSYSDQGEKILLLDEPTNHLDLKNRMQLLKVLQKYNGTIICISHDLELLQMFNKFWHLDNGMVHVFSGSYNNYIRERQDAKQRIEKHRAELMDQRDTLNAKYAKEQQRSTNSSKARGAQGGGVRHNNSAQCFINQQVNRVRKAKEELMNKIAELPPLENTKPNFWINVTSARYSTLLTIRGGSVWRGDREMLKKINFTLEHDDRILIKGVNGSGKSTFLQAILGNLDRKGRWDFQSRSFGFLDQYYTGLNSDNTVLDIITNEVEWTTTEVRRHLSCFLFKSQMEIEKKVSQLSGGERARLSLAKIAAQNPRALILDEITNNIDLETKEHVIEVLNGYKGAMILVSHDKDFVKQIGVNRTYEVKGYELHADKH